MYPKFRAREKGGCGVNPGSSSPLSSIVPAFLEWASSLYIYVLIWKVKKDTHGMHFLPLIAGLLKECSSSACNFRTKHWAKKIISPVLWPTSFSATSCELGPCVHTNLNHGTEPALKWLMDWQSESDTYRSQKAIEAKRKVGARRCYRALGEKYTNTYANNAEKRLETSGRWDIVCVYIRWFLPSLHLLLLIFNVPSFRIREKYIF